MTMEITEFTYIGFADYVAFNSKFATLVPLFKYLGKEGVIRVGNPSIPFPDRGRVFWAPVPAGTQMHSVFRFKVRESPSFDPSAGRHDRYAVDGTPEKLMQIVRSFEDEKDAREWLSSGLELRFPPAGKCLVRIGIDRILGPIELQQGTDGKYRYISGTTNGQIAITAIDEDGILEAVNDGFDYIVLSPLVTFRREVGSVDWDDDEAVLRRAIRLLQKLDESSRRDLFLSDRAVKRLAEVTSVLTLSSLDKYRVERARDIVGRAERSKELCDVLVSEFMSIPQVTVELENLKSETKRDAFEKAQAEVNSSLTQTRAEIARLQTDKDALERKKHEISGEIERLAAQRENLLRELDQSTKQRIDEIVSRPSRLVDELVFLRPIIEWVVGNGLRPETRSDPATTSPSSNSAIECVRDEVAALSFGDCLSKLHSSLPDEAKDIVLPIYSTLIAGAVPCLIGAGRESIVRTVASSFFASTSAEISVHAGMVSIEDLLGSSVDCKGRTIRNFLESARNTPLMHLLVLEGVNRCYGTSAIMPLLKAVDASSRPIWPASQLSNWPSNVLVMMTLDQEGMEFPLPPSFWMYATFCPADVSGLDCDTSVLPSTMSSENWASRLKSQPEPPSQIWRSWLKMKAPECQIPLPIQKRADAIWTSARCVLQDDVAAIATTIHACLFPLLSTLPERERLSVLDVPEHQAALSSSYKRFQEISGALRRRSQHA